MKKNNNLTIVVTGATSMIGSALIESFLRNGVKRIYAVIKENSKKINRIPNSKKIILIKCDIDRYYQLINLINEKCDIFYHFAWSATGPTRNNNIVEQASNIRYTLEALLSAKALGCYRFVGAGSQAEYGKLNLIKISENTPTKPIQPYGVAKYAAGQLALMQSKLVNIDCSWVRIFSVYGKYDKPTSMISYATKSFLLKQKPCFTLAEQNWDYLYRDDAGEAFYYIGLYSKGSGVYCLGNGRSMPLKNYIELIKKEVKYCDLIEYGTKENSDIIVNICADISKITKETGWKPKTDFKDGISEYIKYIRKNEIDKIL